MSEGGLLWDVSMALGDISAEMLERYEAGTPVEPDTIARWRQSISKARRAHIALAESCEEIVESGATHERVEAMKQALTRAMGLANYWARADRW